MKLIFLCIPDVKEILIRLTLDEVK